MKVDLENMIEMIIISHCEGATDRVADGVLFKEAANKIAVTVKKIESGWLKLWNEQEQKIRRLIKFVEKVEKMSHSPYSDKVFKMRKKATMLLNDVMQTNGASQEKPDSSTFADTINFLEKIDSFSMSDKTWLAEQKNLRKEGKELRERLTGKEIEEVKIKKVK